MTVLGVRPLPDATGSEAASSDHRSCGQRAIQAVVRGYGLSPDWLKAQDNAWAYMLRDSVNGFGHGFHAEIVQGTPMAMARSLIPQGRILIVAVFCTGGAEPIPAPGIGPSHWLVLYGTDGQCFNDWQQTYPTYTNLDACFNARVGMVAIWRDGVVPAGNQQPIPSGQPESQRRRKVYRLFWFNGAAYLSDGMFFRWLPNAQSLADVRALHPDLIEHNKQGESVADLAAFGVPANHATANQAATDWN